MPNQPTKDNFLGLVFRLTTALVGSLFFFIVVAIFLQRQFGIGGIVSVLLIAAGAFFGFYLVYREIVRMDEINKKENKK